MEDSDKLILWAVATQPQLNTKIVRQTWVNQWDLNLHDYSVTLKIDGTNHVGRGSDENEKIALSKAISEALERYAIRENLLSSSNGVAAHVNFELAQQSSIDELVERDAYFTQHIHKRPIRNITNILDQTTLTRSFRYGMKSANVEFFAYELLSAKGSCVTMCVAFGSQAEHPFGCLVGLGCSRSLSTSLKKSAIECGRHVAAILAGNKQSPISIDEFNALESYSINDHGRLGLNLEYAKAYRQKLMEQTGGVLSIASRSDDTSRIDVESSELFIKHPIIKSAPLVYVHSHSNQLQGLIVGPEKLKVKNTLEASSQSTHPSSKTTHQIPHCLG